MTEAIRDQNHVTVALGVSSSDSSVTLPLQVDPSTGRLKVDAAGGGGGYTNLTQFVDQTAWRLFYSNVDGDVIEFAFGADGTFLMSQGAAAAPVWTSSTGTGNVVRATSPTLVTPALGTPSALVLTNATGLVATTGLTATGTKDSTTFLRGDNTWAVPSGGGSGTVTSVGFTGGIISVATATTTPALTVAGTSGGIVYFSAANTWASSAALAANAIVIGGGAGVAPSTTTTGTGVLTALGVNVGSAGAFVTFNGALGTPSSGTVTNLTGTASININGTVGSTTPTTGAFTTISASGAITASTTIELGHATDTTLSRSSAGVMAVEGVVIPSISSTNTLTNKRITKRTGTTTSSATPTINTDNVDYYSLTAQTVDITSFTTNLSGTPTLAQQLRIDVTGTAARAITWGASFANGPVALPTTTVTTTRLSVLLEWDGAIWRCMASGSTV